MTSFTHYSLPDFQMFERDLPGQNKAGHSRHSTIGDLPLETCDTINKSWGYNAKDDNFKSPKELIHYLVRAAGNNANLLLNIGPRPDGTIDAESAERLEAIGKWLDQYGETIYGTRGGPVKAQDWGVSTQKGDDVFLHLLEVPPADDEGFVTLSGTKDLNFQTIVLVDDGESLPIRQGQDGLLELQLPDEHRDKIDTVLLVKSIAK